MILLVGLTTFLFGFATKRNNDRKVEETVIVFKDISTPFVTRETVNKLLIVNNQKVAGTTKEKLALNEMEKRVKAHPIIKNADVYVTMSGQVGVNVEQRKPIARINGATSFYIDQSGEKMPLSTNFSARVPLVTGAVEKDMAEVFKLADFIKKDHFLEKHIIGIERTPKGEYILEARKLNYNIMLGKAIDLNAKFSNYKAFYQKALKDNTLSKYNLIKLQFYGQVVCEV